MRSVGTIPRRAPILGSFFSQTNLDWLLFPAEM